MINKIATEGRYITRAYGRKPLREQDLAKAMEPPAHQGTVGFYTLWSLAIGTITGGWLGFGFVW